MKTKKGIGIAALVGIALIGLIGCSDGSAPTNSEDMLGPGIGGDGGDVPVFNDPAPGAPQDEPVAPEAPTDAPKKFIKKRKPCSEEWCKKKVGLPATKSKRSPQPPGPTAEGPKQDPKSREDQTAEEETAAPELAPVVKKTYNVKLLTGEHAGSSSSCDASVKFCDDAQFTNCSNEGGYTNPTLGTWTSFSMKDIPAQNAYFQIRLDNDCASDDDWLLQGVEIKTADNEIFYYNPCVNKWLAPGDHLNFGPKDTAVCAIIGTSGDGYTNTVDHEDVQLVLKGDGSKGAMTTTGASEKGPHFTTPFNGYITMSLNWTSINDYLDFTTLKVTSYGDYFFNSQPFPTKGNHEFEIRKDSDTNWLELDSYEVFVFRPGKFADKEFTVLHQKIANAKMMLTYDVLDTGWISLSVIGVNKFQPGAGLLMGKIILDGSGNPFDNTPITFDSTIGGHL